MSKNKRVPTAPRRGSFCIGYTSFRTILHGYHLLKLISIVRRIMERNIHMKGGVKGGGTCRTPQENMSPTGEKFLSGLISKKNHQNKIIFALAINNEKNFLKMDQKIRNNGKNGHAAQFRVLTPPPPPRGHPHAGNFLTTPFHM